MFTVNHQLISKAEYNALIEAYHLLEPFQTSKHICYAICATDAAMVITMVQLIREHGHSVLLLYGETPLDTARELSAEAGCRWLFYGSVREIHPIQSTEKLRGALPSLYQFSSGTTGGPKLIGRTWTEIEKEIAAYNEVLYQHGLGDCEPVILTSITHSFGLITGVLSALQRGVEPFICQSSNSKYMLQCMLSRPKHLVYAVPTLLQLLLPWLTHGIAAGHRLHAVISSGAPLPLNVYQLLDEQTERLIQQYGCTETGCVSLAVGMKGFDDLGFALSHIKVEASSYPSELMLTTCSGREIRSGDLGTEAPDGRLRFIGRLDDLINVSGLKVHPLEVEHVIARMEGVQEVVVYRGQHLVTGDSVKAMVVGDHTVTEDSIRAWCQKSLPTYKVPSEVELVQEIPRLPSGKISRRLLIQGGLG
ncbi:AMP-binding protein [Paenibacillus sp. 1001270B_150601_E10]|uniref:AMP-binding protein n=1 Tax=Paenibacillus sp. 1001270B_150601_E10 TaxID=2787079 RepID=UPI00189E0EDD|nr:AMP-binding protein [Paenibacillus sp. 1001270B_150601_E10]